METSANFSNLLVFRKALEIFKVSRAIACSLSDNSNLFEMDRSTDAKKRFAGELVSHSLSLAPELAKIQNTSCRSLRLKRARKITKASRLLLLKCKNLELYSIKEKEFLQLLRDDVLLFEKLFRDWYYDLQLKKEN